MTYTKNSSLHGCRVPGVSTEGASPLTLGGGESHGVAAQGLRPNNPLYKLSKKELIVLLESEQIDATGCPYVKETAPRINGLVGQKVVWNDSRHRGYNPGDEHPLPACGYFTIEKAYISDSCGGSVLVMMKGYGHSYWQERANWVVASWLKPYQNVPTNGRKEMCDEPE